MSVVVSSIITIYSCIFCVVSCEPANILLIFSLIIVTVSSIAFIESYTESTYLKLSLHSSTVKLAELITTLFTFSNSLIHVSSFSTTSPKSTAAPLHFSMRLATCCVLANFFNIL